MSEAFVQLPPNSTGVEIRVIQGDATNLIPSGVTEEAVILTDGQGLFSGDSRQNPLRTRLHEDDLLLAILQTLQRLEFTFRVAFDVDANQDDSLAEVL